MFFGTPLRCDQWVSLRPPCDQRHRFVGSVLWQPTYAKGLSSTVARQLLNAWSISTIITAARGQPYNANIGTSILGSAIAGDGGMTRAEVSTFAGPTGGRVSWLARNPFNLPNLTNVDFRLGRRFSSTKCTGSTLSLMHLTCSTTPWSAAVNTTAYTYCGPGIGACAGHTNGCLLPAPSFGSRSTTSGTLYGARQLQFGARFSF